ncbi:sulfite exporter TauE/SafE family protein [Microbulbifer elongatus]|uniref:sulfite exporter TauE/SafE family protein n=1 Tax=Microbulbifer elongatus TaxID=86173 RepID=UPI001CFE207C|nr:sulfite exporter TauE/SafE family protein [Microbulbifer elongatus]
MDQPLFWPLAITGILLTGISKSGFAGGAGVLAVPLLALVMPVPQAAALTLPLLIVMDAKAVWLYRRHIQFSNLKDILPAALVGITLGGFALAWIPGQVLQLALGCFAILFAVWGRLVSLFRKIHSRWMAWGWAGLSGFSSTLLHAGGPPINIYFISRDYPKLEWLGTASVFFAVMNLIKLIPYSLNQQWQEEFVGIWLWLIPVALAGIWLGHWLQNRISDMQFMFFCRLLLFVSGAVLIFKPFIQGFTH